MSTAPTELQALEPQAERYGPAARRSRRAVGHRELPVRYRDPGPGAWRTARAARAATAALHGVVDLLAAGADTTDLTAAIDEATRAAAPLVGWPTHEAMARLLSTARRCIGHRAGSHTTHTCAGLADASRFLQEALRYDGLLPAPAHPGPGEAAFPFPVSLIADAGDGGTRPDGPCT